MLLVFWKFAVAVLIFMKKRWKLLVTVHSGIITSSISYAYSIMLTMGVYVSTGIHICRTSI